MNWQQRYRLHPWSMSAFDLADMATIRAMSAATPKADHARMNWHVRFVPIVGIDLR